MSEITKTQNQKPETNYFWYIFALLAAAVYLTGLAIPLLGPDEPRYSQVAREMFERGDWVTPTLGGFHWFEKPALLYWLQIASYKIFGVSEFAARLGSALFGLGTVLSLWLLGKKAEQAAWKAENADPKPAGNRSFANWLGLIAASTLGIIVFSRGASFDIILTFPITASLVSFFIFDLSENRAADETKKSALFPSALYLASFYFFIGVAVLAKGLVGLVFPPAIVAFYYLLSQRFPPRKFIAGLLWGIPLAVLTAALWYLPMYLTNGWKFIDEFFIQHHFQRYTSNKYLHPQPFYFFFWVLPLMTLPWLPFFLAALWNLAKRLIARRGARNPQAENRRDDKNLAAPGSSFPALGSSFPALGSSLTTFALAWMLVPLVFFSVSGSKLPGYILPAVPAAIVLAAAHAWSFVQKSRARRILVKSFAVLTLVAVGVLAKFFIYDFLHQETIKYLIEKADARGYRAERVIGLYVISHSAEFYAPGRLIRDPEGRQRRLFGVTEVVEEMKKAGERQVLLLVPLDYLERLKKNELLVTEVIGDNDEVAIVLVKTR